MAGEQDDPVDLVVTVGPLDPTVVLLREFLHRSGALRAVALLEPRDGEDAALVDCGRLAPVEVTIGDRTVHLPHAVDLDVEPPALPEIRHLPPLEVDVASGAVTGTIGGVQLLVQAVQELAGMLGGRSVAMVQFETTTPELPFTVSARAGEPVVLAIGDEQFELP